MLHIEQLNKDYYQFIAKDIIKLYPALTLEKYDNLAKPKVNYYKVLHKGSIKLIHSHPFDRFECEIIENNGGLLR